MNETTQSSFEEGRTQLGPRGTRRGGELPSESSLGTSVEEIRYEITQLATNIVFEVSFSTYTSPSGYQNKLPYSPNRKIAITIKTTLVDVTL